MGSAFHKTELTTQESVCSRIFVLLRELMEKEGKGDGRREVCFSGRWAEIRQGWVKFGSSVSIRHRGLLVCSRRFVLDPWASSAQLSMVPAESSFDS